MAKARTHTKDTAKKELSSILRELKIIKAEIRRLKEENRSTRLSIRVLKDKLEDESNLIQERNLEFKDEISGEIKAMREELTVALGQYTRHEETLEVHEKRITSLEKSKFA